MKGKRVYPKDDHIPLLKPGEYGLFGKMNIWFATAPNGAGANLGNHKVTEHEDGSITVSPSILIKSTKGKELFHGFLEKGIWREC